MSSRQEINTSEKGICFCQEKYVYWEITREGHWHSLQRPLDRPTKSRMLLKDKAGREWPGGGCSG